MSWNGYKNYDHYYTCWSTNGMQNWMQEIIDSKPDRVMSGKEYYWNIPASFDIETSSYKKLGVKYATMYMWALCINGSTLMGRTWNDFLKTIHYVNESMHTDKTRLIIYVHNLAYEFQFMRGWFTWKDVFAVKERRPIHATLTTGIEFKCSYILSNLALSYIGKKIINKYKVKKDVGALDYSLVRNWLTNVSDKEIWYNVHDVQVVTSYIQEKIETEGDITNIPLTNTGYVRQYCRNFCFTQMQKEEKVVKKLKARYHERMKSLQIVSECEYDQLHEAFAGGYTHAAPSHSGQTLHNVGSYDLASSYPAVMVTKKFPMARGTFLGSVKVEDIEKLIKQDHWCLLFTIKLYNVTPKFRYEHYISISKCQDISKDAVVNNGRVASASMLQLTVTEQDWDIIKQVYEWDESKTEIHNLRVYPADYLPRPFILSILHLFGNKTSLKGIIERYTEYMVSKGMINAAYGMSVTAIIRDLYEYSNTDDWLTKKANVTEQLQRYNNSYQRFLFYGWGVWVTAHARHNLWKAILEFGEDYVYADTDSIKGLNIENHKLFFALYNLNIVTELKKMCIYWKIPFSLCQPKTIKGEKKTIGIWEREEDYKTFKTIGAKRYIYEYMDGSLNFTVSGVNKIYGVPYLLQTFSNDKYAELYRKVYNPTADEEEDEEEMKRLKKEFLSLHESGEIPYESIFEHFNDGLYFPPGYTGKQTLTYIDNPLVDQCTDYQGNKAWIMEQSCIHMEPQSYFMSQTANYILYLMGYRDDSI